MQNANVKIARLANPAVEPISVDDAKNFLRLETDLDDDFVAECIKTAREECERLADRSFITTRWRLTMDYFPPYSRSWPGLFPLGAIGPISDRNYALDLSDVAIRFPYPALVSVDSVTYVDVNGVNQALDISPGAGNVTIVTGTPGQMAPAFGRFFPFTRDQLGAVVINFTAGYGDDPSILPASVRMAVRFLTTHYYEHRSEQADVPETVQRIINNVDWGGYA